MATIMGIGRFVVKGIHGTISYTGMLSSKDQSKITDLSYSKPFSVSEHRDGQGSVFAVTAGEPADEINVTFTPIAANDAETMVSAKAGLVLPDPLGVVTVAATPGGIAAGDYTFLSGNIRKSTDNTAVIDMVIKKYPACPSTTPQSFIS